MKMRRIIFALSVTLLLAVATSAGNIWHHHTSSTAESNCPICHLGHQAAEQPVVIKAAPVLFAVGSQTPVPEPVLQAGPAVPLLASRAPPSL